MKWDALEEDRRRFGWRRALYRSLYYRQRRTLKLALYRLVLLTPETLSPELHIRGTAASPSDRSIGEWSGEIRALGDEELLRFSSDPENHIPEEFARDALRRGDVCVAALDEGNLASFGWYAHRPTAVESGCTIDFSDRQVYMFHGYTKPEYRGGKLHGAGLAHALRHFCDQGYEGICSLADWTNYASLRSAYRVGFRNIGFAVRARRPQWLSISDDGDAPLWLWTSRQGRRHGIRFRATGERLYLSETAHDDRHRAAAERS